MARALAWNAFASMCLGDFAEAVTVARQARGLLREHGVDLLLEANNNIYALYQSRYLLGDVATFPEEFEALKARAEREGRSLSAVVRQILTEHLEASGDWASRRLDDVSAVAEGPADLGESHDSYLYGLGKKRRR